MSHHITQIENKTARNILRLGLLCDGYHKSILDGALVLEQNGRILYEYVGQYASGSTLWRNPKSKRTHIVNRDGKIS